VKSGLEDILFIFDGSGARKHRFLHGPAIDQPLADERPSTLHWLLPGQLGTITDVIEYDAGSDSTANINHLTYTSFGRIATQTNSANEPYYTYTARAWDGNSELYYYRARWYDPGIGRFVSEDPIGFEGNSFNFYCYASNCPYVLSDPSGLRNRQKCQPHTNCVLKLIAIEKKAASLVDDISRYDPISDACGGHPMGHGKFTKPGGHYREIKERQKGIKKSLKEYIDSCIDCDKGPDDPRTRPSPAKWIDELGSRFIEPNPTLKPATGTPRSWGDFLHDMILHCICLS